MATLTTNLSLTKPATTDFYDIAIQNTNMDLLDTAIAGKAETVHVHPIYGACSTAATTKAKTVSLSQFSLAAGALVVVCFTNGNTNTAGATLNVNATGAKAMYYNGAAVDGSTIAPGDIVTCLYDGAYWQVLNLNTGAGKIQWGTYEGTGTYGINNPMSLELGMVPKMVVICSQNHFSFSTSASSGTTNYFNNSTIWLYGQTYFRTHDTWDYFSNYVTIDGTTMSWYHSETGVESSTNQAKAQLNGSGLIYYYVVFG